METDMRNIRDILKQYEQSINVKPVEDVELNDEGRAALCEPYCPVCHGIGWVGHNLPISHPKFGKIDPCPRSDPFKRYKNIIGLPKEDHSLAWDQIQDIQDTGKAVAVVKNVLARGYGWIYLWGDFGLAKTLILKVALIEYIRRSRQPAAYTRMVEIIDHLRGAFDAKDPSYESEARLDMWADLPLLCIDEFEKVKNTEWASERRFVLMDRRYEQACRQKSITLMASNSDPASLEGYLSDRIYDGRFDVIKLTGKSVRPAMQYRK